MSELNCLVTLVVGGRFRYISSFKIEALVDMNYRARYEVRSGRINFEMQQMKIAHQKEIIKNGNEFYFLYTIESRMNDFKNLTEKEKLSAGV